MERMISGRKRRMYFIYLITLLISSIGASAANMPLEVINIKPAGTGDPPIQESNRIFRAYPGTEYIIRAAVVGGKYPYSFDLIGSPAGMEVDAAGYIRWENPGEDANSIILRVTDSSGAQIEAQWSVTVSEEGFSFVDSRAQAGGDGSFERPFDSISAMTDSVSPTDIIYFRSGHYQLPIRGSHSINQARAFEWNSPSSTATSWLAYPGEQAIIDLGGDKYFYGATDMPFYFQGLEFMNGREYFFRSTSSLNYVTFLDNSFDTLTLERPNYNSNQGTYFTMHSGLGNYLVFQGNSFTGYRGTQGIGSLYDQDRLLVENNIFYDFKGADLASTNQVLAFKVGITRLTLRGNIVNLSAEDNFGIFGGTSINGGFADGDGLHGNTSGMIEITHNFFRHDGSGLCQLNRGNDMGETWISRNTFVSGFQMTNLAPDDCDGPWHFEGNVFQNPSSGLSYHYSCAGDYRSCVSSTNDTGAPSGIVDGSGKLLSGYANRIGELGWQLEDGRTPIELIGPRNACIHQADNSPCDGTISHTELLALIAGWKADSVKLAGLMEAIRIWKNG
jgi:hypothetical protein